MLKDPSILDKEMTRMEMNLATKWADKCFHKLTNLFTCSECSKVVKTKKRLIILHWIKVLTLIYFILVIK